MNKIILLLLLVISFPTHALFFIPGGGGGVSDHGALTGLGDPDHDAVYFQEIEHISSSAGAGDAGKPIVLDGSGFINASMINDSDIDHANLSNVTSDQHHPQLHQADHNSGGGDALKLDDLAAPDDNTDLNSSITAHGLLPKLSNVATEYLNGTGAWSTPPDTDTDTFLTVYIDGVPESALAPTLNFNSSFFTLTEAPANTFAIVIADDAVTYAKMQNVVADNVFLGNNSGAGAIVDELTGTEATAMLDLFTDTLKGLAPAYPNNTTDFLRGDGTWAVPPGGSGGGGDRATWRINGPVSVFSFADGYWVAEEVGSIEKLWLLALDSGSSGTTTVKLHRAGPSGATNQDATLAGVGGFNQSEVTLGSPISYVAGDYFWIEITGVAVNAEELTVIANAPTGGGGGGTDVGIRFNLQGVGNTTFERIDGYYMCNSPLTFTTARLVAFDSGDSGTLTVTIRQAGTGTSSDTADLIANGGTASDNDTISLSCVAGDYIWVDITGVPSGDYEDLTVVLFE